jgi:hypothetical protein
MTNEQKFTRLDRIAAKICKRKAAYVHVSEHSWEDSTPTLHLDLWRGFDLHDLCSEVNALEIASEGGWGGGRRYSLQLTK